MRNDNVNMLVEAIMEQLKCSIKPSLNNEEAARYLGISEKTLAQLRHERIIPYYKPNGKTCYYLRAELDEWMKSGRQATAQELSEKARIHCNLKRI